MAAVPLCRGPILATDERLSNLQGLLVKFAPMLGLKPEEARPLWDALAARMKDVRALIHGGQLSDGTTIPGFKELYAAIQRVEAKQDRVVDAVFRVHSSSFDPEGRQEK